MYSCAGLYSSALPVQCSTELAGNRNRGRPQRKARHSGLRDALQLQRVKFNHGGIFDIQCLFNDKEQLHIAYLSLVCTLDESGNVHHMKESWDLTGRLPVLA